MIKPLEFSDARYLQAAIGWLELGNPLEANTELENITPEFRAHPDVLEIRWQIYAKQLKWDACREIAQALTHIAADRPSGWIHLSYATRRVSDGGLQAAYAILSSVVGRFPHQALMPFNLACYATQLGNLAEAREWLQKAFAIGDAKEFKLMALKDPDLAPLWNETEL